MNKDVWQTPAGNIALTNEANARVDAACDYFESQFGNDSKEKVIDEMKEVNFELYEIVTMVQAVYSGTLPKGLREKVQKVILRIDEYASKSLAGIC